MTVLFGYDANAWCRNQNLQEFFRALLSFFYISKKGAFTLFGADLV